MYEAITEMMDITQQTVANIIDSTKKRQMSDFGKDFKPFLYNQDVFN